MAFISSVRSLSHVWLFATAWTAAHQASPSITNSWSLLKLMSIESIMPSNHLILCHPLLLPPSIFSSIRVFSNESALPIRWPKYWSFSFSISPSNEYSGLISFRVDWLDLLAVQGTLKSLLQYYSSKWPGVGRSIGTAGHSLVVLGLCSLYRFPQGDLEVCSRKGQGASILQHSAFFIVQLSHPYMSTGKTIALTLSKP